MKSNNYRFNNDILLIEDDIALSELLKIRLRSHGYNLHHEASGEKGLEEALSHKYKLIILDIGLPQIDGLSILKTLQQVGIHSEIIVITSASNDRNELETFKRGGSIFHPKPLNLELFDAQVSKLISRSSFTSEIELADLFIEPEKMFVRKGKTRVDLTPREFEILMYIIDANGGVMDRSTLLSHISKGREFLEESSIDKIVSRARKKIGTYMGQQIIETVHRKGYRINPICYEEDPADIKLP